MPSVMAAHGPIEYQDEGTGAPVILINGLGAQLIRWPAAFLDALRRHGLRVIRLDNRDAGLSHHHGGAGAPDLRAVARILRNGGAPDLPYSLTDMAGDVTALLDALGIARAHVVGMSMGGYIAQLVAAGAPERVVSLTLLMTASGNPDLPGPTREAQAALARRSAVATNREALLADAVAIQRAIGSPAYPADPAVVRARAAAEIDRAHDPQGHARQRAAILADGDRRDRIAAIACPTLVLHGEDDPLVGVAGGRELADLIGDSRLRIFAGMGHEIPSALAEVLAAEIADHVARAAARAPSC